MDLHVLNVEGVEDFRSQKMNPMKMTFTGTDGDVTYTCVLVLFPGNISSERLVSSCLVSLLSSLRHQPELYSSPVSEHTHTQHYTQIILTSCLM